MGVINIYANGIPLDFVKETLSIRKENNAFITDFKVSHSSFPFLIVENDNAKRALGTRDIASVIKNKVVPVVVLEMGERYYGELQVLSYMNGYRKCNLKYGTALLQLMQKKIKVFMPVVSVIPDETDPVPYSEKAEDPIPGYEHWPDFVEAVQGSIFPDALYQFPVMFWLYKFGEALSRDDDWHKYRNAINNRDNIIGEGEPGGLLENSYDIITGDSATVTNQNIASPQIFLLSPLKLALDELGFTATGNFPAHPLVKRILMFSEKDNMTEVSLREHLQDVDMSALTWNEEWYNYTGVLPMWGFVARRENIVLESAGTLVFKFEVTEPDYTQPPYGGYLSEDFPVVTRLTIKNPSGGIEYAYLHKLDSGTRTYNGSISFEVLEEHVGDTIFVEYISRYFHQPAHQLSLEYQYPEKFYEMHPTIDLSRFVPDWTFATYLNHLKNTFNLDIFIDDFRKQLVMNFNEDFIANPDIFVSGKSLKVESYDSAPYDAFILQFDNEDDAALYITRAGAAPLDLQSSDFQEIIKNGFKYIPLNNYTAELSEELADRDGVGLMIYDPANAPFVSPAFNGATLAMDGDGGIYQTFWKKTLQFRLNASLLEMTGPYTEKEITGINNIKKIYIDHQAYVVTVLEYQETPQGNYRVKMSLESINL